MKMDQTTASTGQNNWSFSPILPKSSKELVKEFTNDSSDKIASGGIKYDGGKVCAYRGSIGYFPRALEQVAAVSTFGANKYAWNGWEAVPEGLERYSDAMVRHMFAAAKGESTDKDSGLLHEAHAAWNALARLELKLRQLEN